jgi:hydroxymethylpyrimidine/phosphomethylpyrimidine kinase
MVYDAPQIAVITETLKKYQPAYVVLDPVMVSTSGNSLLKDEALDALREQLFPLASLITPNIPEAEVLTKMKLSTPEELETAARMLGETYHTAILLKGGHSPMHCNDFLYAEGKGPWILGERIHTKNTHGTGCTLSSAIATALAQGYNLQDSVKRGKDYITHALQAGLTLGHGNGPIAHNWTDCT